jgi:glycosyltransferase involved in cell wall biosynthesis
VTSVILAAEANAEKRAAVAGLYPHADAIVAVSSVIKRDLIEHFGIAAGRIRTIHNPVDLEAIARLSGDAVTEYPWTKPKPETKARTSDDMPVVINVAAAKPRKRQHVLLEAFRLVRNRIPCRLALLGHGTTDEPIATHVARLGLTEDVALLGFQANPFKFLAHASVFVLPSRCEGFPNVLLEAMACRLPIVTTEWAGARELVTEGRTGLVVPLDDEVRLAEAILRMVTSKEEASRFGEAAGQEVRRFGRDRIVGRYARLFHAHARRAATRISAAGRAVEVAEC